MDSIKRNFDHRKGNDGHIPEGEGLVYPTDAHGCPHWFSSHPCDICMKDNPKYAESVKCDLMTDRELHNAWRDLRVGWSKEDWIDFYETLKAFKARVVARSQRPHQTPEPR